MPSESADEMIQKACIAAHFAEEQNLLYSAYNKNFDNNSVKRLSLLGTMKETLMADEFILFLQSKEWSSKEIFDIPGEMGCDPAQSKPLSENEFKRWLSTSPWRL